MVLEMAAHPTKGLCLARQVNQEWGLVVGPKCRLLSKTDYLCAYIPAPPRENAQVEISFKMHMLGWQLHLVFLVAQTRGGNLFETSIEKK